MERILNYLRALYARIVAPIRGARDTARGWFRSTTQSAGAVFNSLGIVAAAILGTIGWAIFIGAAFSIAPLATVVVGGLVISFYITIFLMALVPGFIDRLAQDPNLHRPNNATSTTMARSYRPGKYGFFIFPYPGRVFLIERGGRFIRAIMSYPDHIFRGEIENPENEPERRSFLPKDPEYWEVLETPAGESDSHPIPFPVDRPWFWIVYSPFSVLWWVWKRYVYWVVGAVFTGIHPFQGVRVYPMERFKEVTLDSGETELVRIEDYSNHYRVAHFQYPVKIANVDTNDKIPVKVLLNTVAHCYNPFMTAYETDDDWTTRLSNLEKDAVTGFARSRPLTEVWTAEKARTRELAKKVRLIGRLDIYKNLVYEAEQKKLAQDRRPAQEVLLPDDEEAPDHSQRSTCAFGIVIDSVNIIDISPMNPDDTEKLGDVARAEVRMEAAKRDAKGAVAVTEETARIIKENEDMLRDIPHAAQIMGMETSVRIAQAAGTEGNLVYITGNTSQASDPNQALTLQELRRIRRQEKRAGRKAKDAQGNE